MATKLAQPMVHSHMEDLPQIETARFEIEGLTPLGDGTFSMDVKRLNVEWNAIEVMLQDAGVPQKYALMYVEGFVSDVINAEMARVLAERMKRVG